MSEKSYPCIEEVRAIIEREPPDLFDTPEAAEAAVDEWHSPIHSIRHVVPKDGKWAILGHINCESCEWCGKPGRPANTRHLCTVHA